MLYFWGRFINMLELKTMWIYISGLKWYVIIYPYHMWWITISRCLHPCNCLSMLHYIDVIMTTIASQITSLTVVYSTVYSDADQRKHQSSASLAFVRGIHRDRWIPRTKGQLRGNCFHLMTSSCNPPCWFSSVLVKETPGNCVLLCNLYSGHNYIIHLDLLSFLHNVMGR